ncbi:hypothetical protein M0Q97_04625, partial [Candidatus Dojkabacteria bacterium]|nr:hypothetical protein [Candidatus Dojkabacteria bacterium]
SCPAGTSTTGSYGYKTTVSCTNNCGMGDSKRCYCTSACTLAACPAGTSTTGSYGYKTTVSCTNNCGMGDSKDCYCTTPCPL